MDRIASMMDKYDMPDDMPIQAKIVTKAVESAQRKVEQINFSMRKNVLDYDDVMNKQRQVIYEERNKILDGKDLVAHVEEVTLDTVQRRVSEFCPEDGDPESWDLKGLSKWMQEAHWAFPDGGGQRGHGAGVTSSTQSTVCCLLLSRGKGSRKALG